MAVTFAVVTAVAVAASALLMFSGGAYAQEEDSGAFDALGTFEVPGEEGVAEIVAATPDGQTLVYTDSGGGTVGFVDLSDAADPELAGEPVDVDGTPTSVGVSPDGSLALVAVQTSELEEGRPPELTPGRLVAVDVASREVVGSVEIGVGPDSLAVSEVGGEMVAVVAIENEPVVVDRAGNLTDDGDPGSEGDLSDPGLIQVVTLDPDDIAASEVSDVEPDLSGTGLPFPDDPQPEFVDLSSDGRAAVSLQENNGVAVFDVAAAIAGEPHLSVFGLGVVADRPEDLTDDGEVSLTDTYPADALEDEPQAGIRVADAVAWSPNDSVLYTANEGEADLTGGRGFSAFSPEGELLFDDGGQLAAAAAERGLYPEDAAREKGLEVEGVEVGIFGASEYLFVGSEAGSFVAVYQIADPTSPEFDGILPTGDAPEGLLAIPERDLFVTADEDSGTISVFGPAELAEDAAASDLPTTGGLSPGAVVALGTSLFLAVATILITAALGVRAAWRSCRNPRHVLYRTQSETR